MTLGEAGSRLSLLSSRDGFEEWDEVGDSSCENMTLYRSISGVGRSSSSLGVDEAASGCGVDDTGEFAGSLSPRKKVARHGLGDGVNLSHGEHNMRVKDVLTELRDSHRDCARESDGIRECSRRDAPGLVAEGDGMGLSRPGSTHVGGNCGVEGTSSSILYDASFATGKGFADFLNIKMLLNSFQLEDFFGRGLSLLGFALTDFSGTAGGDTDGTRCCVLAEIPSGVCARPQLGDVGSRAIPIPGDSRRRSDCRC